MSRDALAAEFRVDPAAALIGIVRDAGRAVRKKDILAMVVAAGVPEATADRAWSRLQPLIKDHPQVTVVRSRLYEWTADPVDPFEALVRLRRERKTRTPQWLVDSLAEVVNVGLRAGDPSARQLPPPDPDAREIAVRAAQERQWRIDVVRAVAEMAMAVEEITYKGADPDGIVERVRNQALARSLDPISAAGEQTTFDPAQHKPLADSPAAGSPVLVVRPGYRWRTDDEDLLIERAVVRTI